jgi:hypothetical protein
MRQQHAASHLAPEIGPPPLTKAQRSKGTRLRNKRRNDLGLFNSLVFPSYPSSKVSSGVSGHHRLSMSEHVSSFLMSGTVVELRRSETKNLRTRTKSLTTICFESQKDADLHRPMDLLPRTREKFTRCNFGTTRVHNLRHFRSQNFC